MMTKEVRMHIGVYCLQIIPGIVVKPYLLSGVYVHSWLLHSAYHPCLFAALIGC